MSSAHNILVCTEDSVLAKKLRILLARDECEIEVLSTPQRLDRRIEARAPSLLVVSSPFASEDASILLSRLAEAGRLPPTIVIGATGQHPPETVHVLPDASDTQTLYRLASEALAMNGRPDRAATVPRIDAMGREALTGKTQRMKPTRGPREPITKSNEPPPLDLEGMELSAGDDDDEQTAAALTAAAHDPGGGLRERVSPDGTIEDTTVFDVTSHTANKGRAGGNLGLSGVLEPARFAKVLFQCWTMEAQGALVVATTDETITVTFEDGLPVHLESNQHGDLFGRNLVTKGRLTDDQYGEAAKISVEKGLSIGGAIVELGFLNREAYGRELGEDAHDRILKRFAMRGGAFEFVPNRRPPVSDRPYRISVGRILVEGLKRFADDAAITEICGDVKNRYFRVRSPIEDLAKRFPLTDKEKAFLGFSGRAYNIQDAADVAGLDVRGASVLMALLITCDEYETFTPGVAEFEARIREERQRQDAELRALRSDVPGQRPAGLPDLRPQSYNTDRGLPLPSDGIPGSGLPPLSRSHPPPPPPPVIPPPAFSMPMASGAGLPAPMPSAPPAAQSSAGEAATQRPAESGDGGAIPPMPGPPPGQQGRTPRPVVFAPSSPRGPDGVTLETQERTRSRQHFQRGVALLGQGNFDDAEEAFRDAIALCSEEHVYLIGLARSVYYNATYTAAGKLPVLRTIVDRAAMLAPEDGRVLTLREWVRAAEVNRA